MTDEEIHNIYLHMSGKAEGLVEATGTADFPVMFARAILEYEGLTKDVQNMASKSTYKEQLETKDEPAAYINVEERKLEWATEFITWETPTVVNLPKIPLYTTPQRTWVGLKDDDEIPWDGVDAKSFARAIEAKLKEKNT
jgi:hypothetical protein